MWKQPNYLYVNPFVPNAPVLYPLKTSENLTVVKNHIYVFQIDWFTHGSRVAGKYVKRGAGYGLEILYQFYVSGKEKAVAWLSKKVNLIIKEHECVVNRCLDEKKK